MNIERELCLLTKKYEAEGFTHYFHLENGSLVCDDFDLILQNPGLIVHDSLYYPKRHGLPYGFCIFALTVIDESTLWKGIFLIPEGLLALEQVSPNVNCQLHLNDDYPQLFNKKADIVSQAIVTDT